MDKTIHKHLDNRLDIQESAAKMLERVFLDIDIKAVLKDPKAQLAKIAHVAMAVTETHAKDALVEGLRFAKEVKSKGKVSFVESEDPSLNKEDAPSVD